MADRVPERKVTRWQHRWDRIENLAAEVNDASRLLLAVAEHVGFDAWPTTTVGNETHGEGDHADPVLATVIANIDATRHDVIADHLREINAVTSEILGHLRRVARLKDIIVNRRDPRTYDTGGNCKACGRYVSGSATDRLRAMYCDTCYRAWNRYREARNDPAHHLFEKERREVLDRKQQAEGAA